MSKKRTTVSLPPEIHMAVKAAGKLDRRRFSAELTTLIEEALAARAVRK